MPHPFASIESIAASSALAPWRVQRILQCRVDRQHQIILFFTYNISCIICLNFNINKPIIKTKRIPSQNRQNGRLHGSFNNQNRRAHLVDIVNRVSLHRARANTITIILGVSISPVIPDPGGRDDLCQARCYWPRNNRNRMRHRPRSPIVLDTAGCGRWPGDPNPDRLYTQYCSRNIVLGIGHVLIIQRGLT